MRRCSLAICLLTLPFSLLPAQINIGPQFLPGGSVNSPYAVQLLPGEAPQYQWSIASGTLPPGLSLSATGAITGVPTAAGNFSFLVSVHNGTQGTGEQSLSISIAGLTVTTFYLPTSIIGQSYSVQLAATGGSGGPYQWALAPAYPAPNATANGTLPQGLTMSAGGLISGASISVAGLYYFQITALDPATKESSLPEIFALAVGACQPTITPANLPRGEVGAEYSVIFHSNSCSSGFFVPFITPNPSDLPPGVTINGINGFSGVPQFAGTYKTAGVFGGPSVFGEAPFVITIVAGPSFTAAATLPSGIVGVPYAPFQIGVSSGTPPYALGVLGLPPGIIMSSDGGLRGTPTSDGAFSFTVTLSDKI